MEAERSKAQTDALHGEEAKTVQHMIFFLPYLRLKTCHSIAGVDFSPFRDPDGRVTPYLQSAAPALSRILSSYIDRHGTSYDNCAVATIPGRGWDLNRTDGSTISWSASLLFLASWTGNQYFSRGAYTNSSSFRVVAQAFTGDKPVYMAVGARRRDGYTWDGGYQHGELHFSTPVQCPLRDAVVVDTQLLAALNKALASDSETIGRLRTALPFVQLTNTDDDVMTADTEAILMASAFEQLLNGDGKRYKLGTSFGKLFQDFGNVNVASARQTRHDIEIGNKPEHADAQHEWWVHRKWVEELYSLRNKVAHEGSPGPRKWAWRPDEHLVMAAFVFPLAVKLLLSREGHYAITCTDEAHCRAIDKLLATTAWDGEPEGGGTGSTWYNVVADSVQDHELDKCIRAAMKKHPDLFADEGGGKTTL